MSAGGGSGAGFASALQNQQNQPGGPRDPNKPAFAFGNELIWKHPAFLDLFFDAYGDVPPPKKLTSGAFFDAMDLVYTAFTNLVEEQQDWLSALQPSEMVGLSLLLPTLAEAKIFSTRTHINAQSDQAHSDYLNDVFNKIQSMVNGGTMLLPGGWSDSNGGHNVLFILHRKPEGFVFAVCNTGDGLRYHPYTCASSPYIEYKLALVVEKIPVERIFDSSFWFMLLRLQVSLVSVACWLLAVGCWLLAVGCWLSMAS